MNGCLRSSRSRRVAQGRTSLPYATPLLLSSSVDGRLACHPSDDEGQIHQQVFLSGKKRLFGGQDQKSQLAASSQRFGSGWQHEACCLVKTLHPGAFCQYLVKVISAGHRGENTIPGVANSGCRQPTPYPAFGLYGQVSAFIHRAG